MKLSNQPPKGTADWFPEEFAVRKYIFDTWRKVCKSFGYQEYLTPIIESAEVYRAKSGEDVGGKELTVFRDRADRELAIRPEMTPSVTRMITRKYESMPKPIRFFSIANFFRNEKPQRGRNREFWQLNYDVFGSNSSMADVEVVQVAIEIMLALKANKDQFVVFLNDRTWIDTMIGSYIKAEVQETTDLVRYIDKFEKMTRDDFKAGLGEVAQLDTENQDRLVRLLEKDPSEVSSFTEFMSNSEGGSRLEDLMKSLTNMGYGEYIEYNPRMVRGFDYYDGIIFEVYSKGEINNRSLFGGGRYNGLAKLFGDSDIPATGAAPGDETLKLFLEEWNLIPEDLSKQVKTYVPVLDESLIEDTTRLANKLRSAGSNVEVGLEVQKFGKALEYADKNGFSSVAILGTNEKAAGTYKIKDMVSGEEQELQLS